MNHRTKRPNTMEFDFDESNDSSKTGILKHAFYKLADDRDLCRNFPEISRTADELRTSDRSSNEDEAEIAFLNLYCAIHGAGANYSLSERDRLDKKKGYFNHPGGISPLLKAESYIGPDSVIADLGAGNGLQGLLFQVLYPHRCTLQIELSAEMIEIGQQFQEILGIPDQKMEWINDDIMNISLDSIDFLYLYRPSKPMQNGVTLYHNIAKKLHGRSRRLTIFSIADCLKEYLNSGYRQFYSDGHLTCFETKAST